MARGSGELEEVVNRTLLEQRQALDWFERSLAQSDTERDGWLDVHCTDAAIRERVRRLQRADVDEDDFLLEPHASLSAATIATGSRVGAYRIDRLLAEGGMGSVYLAHRDDGVYEQQVAIKFLHPLMRNPEASRRFAAERQILAQLQHPNIAQMLDAGSSDDGMPYVVMEYVDGLPITKYCRQHDLNLGGRLDLFRQVCSAVATAHRSLVVHRDLKPGNILVTEDGRPMLLDFGIAKILQAEADNAQGDRATTMMALTPAYASPEQIQRHVITTSSDIYSLGVLLYELLCGKRPYELDRLTPAQAEQLVCDTAPPLPSQIAAHSHAQDAFSATPRMLRGDLDVITMKALRKEPERRYGSAQELSEDVHRYLRGLPIQARADSFGYRVRKFAGRNRWGVAAATLIFLSLVGGILTTSWQAHRAQQQASRAEAQSARAEQINDFFKKILMSPSSQWLSSLGKGADVGMAEVLDVASQRADTELAHYPDVQVDVLGTLSQAFQGMGLYDKAKETAARALKVAQDKLPADHKLQVTAHYRLAQALYRENELSLGEKHYLRAVALAEKVLPADAEMTALLHNDLAVLYAGQHRIADAEREMTIALDLQRRRLHGKPYPAVAIGLSNLGFLRMARGDLDTAKGAFEESLAEFSRLPEREYAEEAYSYTNRSTLYSILGNFSAADADARRGEQIARKLFGRTHPLYASMLLRRAEAALDQGHPEHVPTWLEQAGKIVAERVPASHPTRASLEIVRARWLMAHGKFAGASQSLEKAKELLQTRQAAADRNPSRDQARVLALLGEVRIHQGRLAEGEDLLAQGIAMETAIYGSDVYEVKHFSAVLEKARSRDQVHAKR